MSHLRCPATGKRGYRDRYDAVRALRSAANVRRKAYTAQRWAKRGKGELSPVLRKETRAYECPEVGCGLWHLTSSRAYSVDVATVSIGGWEA